MENNENHLKGQSSPYLLQHLYNPVDWYPWGDIALEKARNEDKPLLISIGYSACHWCHVMEKESFEDEHIARVMNDNFVCIKVDREERPDIDHLYMSAVQLITGRGGWPLNCFALPDGRPFWGATYFPAEQWKNILLQISDLFKNQRESVEKQAEELTHGVAQSSILVSSASKDEEFLSDVTDQMYQSIIKNIDMHEGGNKGAPKFPLPVIYEFLLHYHHHTHDAHALDAINLSLKKMAMGGIYDHLAGGFCRYSTDELWKVPHFEKMLYDNAQLVSLYSKVWKVSPQTLYRDVVYQTLEFVKQELTSPEGCFYSALDADSEGEEGKFYVWRQMEFDEALGIDSNLASEYFNVGGEGLWEKSDNILLKKISDEDFARINNLTTDQLHEKVQTWRTKLLKLRNERTRPGLDNKILTSWNGMMISGLTDAYKAFNEPEFLNRAEKASDYILNHALEPDGKLLHTVNSKQAIDGFLEDYAFMVQALINLYQATIREDYLFTAEKITHYVLDNFSDSQTNMFSFSSGKGEKLAASHFEFMDNVQPASNSIMAKNLFYLGNYFEHGQWVEKSRKMLSDIKPHIEKYGRWVPVWGSLWLSQVKDFYTLAICGQNLKNQLDDFNQKYLPDMMIAGTEDGTSGLPILKNRYLENQTLIYPCTLNSCLTPENDIRKALEKIS
jgi:uncharacterized protein